MCIWLVFYSGNSWTIGTKNLMSEDRLQICMQHLYENIVHKSTFIYKTAV